MFLTLPVVLLQAPTTQNDLVAASGLTAAAVFLTGTSTAAMGIAGLATALAVGTKVPAIYGLPLLLVLVLTAPAPKRRIARLLALGAGTALGAYWYVVNLPRWLCLRAICRGGRRYRRRLFQTALRGPPHSFRPLRRLL